MNMQMTKIIKQISCCLVLALGMASCSETDGTWDPDTNWQARNAAWYEQVSDSARTAIAQAKAQYGEEWEAHCEWRRFKTLQKSADYDTQQATDSVCVHILKRGTREGALMPHYSDTIRASYRLFLMPTQYEGADGALYTQQKVADQTYYGDYDAQVAAPAVLAVASTVEGFSTALQYMVPGDEWLVYIPQQMAYGSKAQTTIPAYSTLQFHLCLHAVYRAGSGVPSWK